MEEMKHTVVMMLMMMVNYKRGVVTKKGAGFRRVFTELRLV